MSHRKSVSRVIVCIFSPVQASVRDSLRRELQTRSSSLQRRLALECEAAAGATEAAREAGEENDRLRQEVEQLKREVEEVFQ